MSYQNVEAWKKYGKVLQCWVPNCSNGRNNGYTKAFFLLPIDAKYREIWIAMAGKKLTGSPEEIYFCQEHFVPSDIEIIMNQALFLKRSAIPYNGMPQRICRTCMSLIGRNESFSVLSRTFPCNMPTEMNLNMPQCRPEPLYQILTFCIPDLNLQADPPPLVCCKCYQNIWIYFVYKITCNAVEKGLRGNLTPEEYGKMVLCRTCPETSGTSFFVLSEETLMGLILKKMFLNEFPSDIVPLKVCLRCWNTLYKIKNFYEQCVAADEKMQRHIILNQTGLGNVSQYPATIPTPLDTFKTTVSRLRDVRKSNNSLRNTDPNIKNDMAYPQVVDKNIGTANVTSITKPQNSSSLDSSALLPCSSVIKFSGNIEKCPGKVDNNMVPPDAKVRIELEINTPKTTLPEAIDFSAKSKESQNGMRPDLQYQEQHDSYKRAYTWVPPFSNTKPVNVQKSANTWIPPATNTLVRQSISIQEKPNTRSSSVTELQSATKPATGQEKANAWTPSITNVQSIPIQEKSNTFPHSVANQRSNTEEDHRPHNVPRWQSTSTGSCDNALDKKDSEAKIGYEPKPSNNVPDVDKGLKNPKVRFLTSERISLAWLMLMYGEPLKYKANADVQFSAWINIVREFHKINNQRPLESIQNMWGRMKRKAELAFAQIGPSNYEDQLVINYLHNYPMPPLESTVQVNCDVICIDDEVCEVHENVADKGNIKESNVESGESSSKSLAVADHLTISKTKTSLSSTKIKKNGRGRPKKIPANENTPQEMKSDKLEKKTELANEQIGPSNYNYNYPVKTNIPVIESTVNLNKKDCNVICIDDDDDEMCEANANVADKGKVEVLNIESGESSSKIPVSSTKIKKRKRGRPKGILTKEASQVMKKNSHKKLKMDVFSYSKVRRKKRGRPKLLQQMSNWGYKENLELARAIRKEYDKSLQNNELLSGRSPWRMLLKRLAHGKYSGYDLDKLYYLWNRIKRSATIYEKNGLDLVDEEVWELLQIQNAVQNSITKNSHISTRVIEKVSTTIQNNQSQISSKNTKIDERDAPSCSKESNNFKLSVNSRSNVSGKPVSHQVPVKTSPSSGSKLNTESTTDYKKNPQYWTEDEKIEFFKLIKREFNSIMNNGESLALPWRTIIERIASRGYKNCSQEMLFSAWSSIRRNASLHENDRQLTVLDCKVLRLLRVANKLKKVKATVKTGKGGDGQKIRNVAQSDTILDKSADSAANSETVLSKNKHKKTSRTIADEDNQRIKGVAETPHDDEGDDESDDDGDRNSRNWTPKEKLDLIEVIRNYDNEIFKIGTKRTDFWPLVVKDHRAKGYKRGVMQIKSYWHNMFRSAKLAWAQQKESSEYDKSIIEFMMEVIEQKKKRGEYSGGNMDHEDNSDDISDSMNELNNDCLENDDETNTHISLTDEPDDNKISANQGDLDDAADVKLNYDYVSLEDIESDYESKTVEPTIKTELSYVSMEDCAIEVPPTSQSEEVIVIDDSEEE